MGTLTALLFATPVFGLSLSIGGLEPGLPMATPPLRRNVRCCIICLKVHHRKVYWCLPVPNTGRIVLPAI